MIRLLETVPFSLFLLFVRNMDTPLPQNWRLPFLVSGGAALGVILFLVYRRLIFNRLLLGINLYLMGGTIGFITGHWWLNNIYLHLQASGLLAWIFLTGLVSTLISPHGFIGSSFADSSSVKKQSAFLLLCTGVAFVLSYIFRGDRLLSEILPFTGLFILQAILRARLKEDYPYGGLRP